MINRLFSKRSLQEITGGRKTNRLGGVPKLVVGRGEGVETHVRCFTIHTTSCTCHVNRILIHTSLASPLIHSEKVKDTMKAAALILCVFAWLFVATIAKPADDGPLCAFCMTTTGWIEGKSEVF